MEEQVQISFRLDSITNESVNINATDNVLKDMDPETIRFQYRVNVELNLSKETITVTPDVRYKCREVTILTSEAQFVYSVPGLKANTLYNSETGEIKQKADIIPTLASASFSSLRGMIHFATKETPVNEYPVPLVGIDSLIQKIGISVVE